MPIDKDKMDAHRALVAGVSDRVKHFHATKQPFRLYHGSTNSTRQSHRSADNTVDTSGLNKVLAVDTATRTVLAEPNVPLGDLVEATLPHGLVPPVVMEFPTITVGGGFSGSSGESSSFKHGAFEATVQSIEIVLADGTVATSRRDDGESAFVPRKRPSSAPKPESQGEGGAEEQQTEEGTEAKGNEEDDDDGKPDLLWGAASSFGTIGVVTLIEVRLRPAKAFVELQYIHCTTPEQYVDVIEAEAAKDEVEFLDGIVYSRDSTVICSGKWADEVPRGQKPVTFTGRFDPWFYLRAQEAEKKLRKQTAEADRRRKKKLMSAPGKDGQQPQEDTKKGGEEQEEKQEPFVDFIPIRDYLFRYNRGGFWTGRYAFSYFLTPFTRLTRAALDTFLHTSVMYHAMHKSGMHDMYVIQDVGVPYGAAPGFHRWLDDTYGIYPLWLCPLRIRRDSPRSAHGLHAQFADPAATPETLLNYGVWGPVPGAGNSPDRADVVRQNRLLEERVQQCGGKKWLYSHAYYTEDEFWSHYDRDAYDAVRQRYGAGHLPDIYHKVRVDVEAEDAALAARPFKALVWKIWPLRGLYGVYCAWAGGDYLLEKSKAKAKK